MSGEVNTGFSRSTRLTLARSVCSCAVSVWMIARCLSFDKQKPLCLKMSRNLPLVYATDFQPRISVNLTWTRSRIPTTKNEKNTMKSEHLTFAG